MRVGCCLSSARLSRTQGMVAFAVTAVVVVVMLIVGAVGYLIDRSG
jgi:hypothetical protein